MICNVTETVYFKNSSNMQEEKSSNNKEILKTNTIVSVWYSFYKILYFNMHLPCL